MPPINNMAKSHCITTDTLHAVMSFPKLMHCLDEPMQLEMVVIHKEIYQNLATFLLPFGTGHAGFLGIMMLEVLYAQCFNNPFQQPSIQASTLLTFLPTRLPNNAVNSSSITKHQNRSTTPSRRSHSASRTNSWRQSTRTIWLSSTILT